MRKSLAVVTAILVAMLGAARAETIRDDQGGMIWRYEQKYFGNPATRWVIDGRCDSACTMVLGTGRVCATGRARLGFHAGSIMPLGYPIIDAEATQRMVRRYPASVKAWVKRTGAVRSLRMTFMRQPEISRHIPRC